MTDENTVWFTQGTVFKLVCSQGILTLKLRHLQKKKKTNYQQPSRKRSACSYPSVVPTAAISIVMPYDLVGHIFKIQQLHIGCPVKG